MLPAHESVLWDIGVSIFGHGSSTRVLTLCTSIAYLQSNERIFVKLTHVCMLDDQVCVGISTRYSHHMCNSSRWHCGKFRGPIWMAHAWYRPCFAFSHSCKQFVQGKLLEHFTAYDGKNSTFPQDLKPSSSYTDFGCYRKHSGLQCFCM